MPDEFRFAINPVVQEANARRLVDIMAQCFPESGGICEDLRRKFEEITGLKRQSFYDTLAYCKYRQWITGGGLGVPYRLSDDGSWKPPPISVGEAIGEPLSRDQLEYLANSRAQQVDELQTKVERLLNWSSDEANGNVALASLMKIVGDDDASTRQLIKASAAVLGYKAQADVSEFVRKYLQSVCESIDIAIDYKIEAGELLRRHESPRIAPETVRPAYREAEPMEPPEPLMQLLARRLARQEMRDREREAQQAADASDTVELPPQVEQQDIG